nr:hypothetical protein [Leisingera sp. M527]
MSAVIIGLRQYPGGSRKGPHDPVPAISNCRVPGMGWKHAVVALQIPAHLIALFRIYIGFSRRAGGFCRPACFRPAGSCPGHAAGGFRLDAALAQFLCKGIAQVLQVSFAQVEFHAVVSNRADRQVHMRVRGVCVERHGVVMATAEFLFCQSPHRILYTSGICIAWH